jgi:hypothetical protein
MDRENFALLYRVWDKFRNPGKSRFFFGILDRDIEGLPFVPDSVERN